MVLYVISDQPGPEGTEELLAFAAKANLSDKDILWANSEHEHIWTLPEDLDACLKNGAVSVVQETFTNLISTKREAHIKLGFPVRVWPTGYTGPKATKR